MTLQNTSLVKKDGGGRLTATIRTVTPMNSHWPFILSVQDFAHLQMKNLFVIIFWNISGGSLGSICSASRAWIRHSHTGKLCWFTAFYPVSRLAFINWKKIITYSGHTWPRKSISSSGLNLVGHEASAPLVTVSVSFCSTI